MLRAGGLKPSITELLHLLDVLKHGVSEFSVENFYYLAKTTMIKDEALYDRFDQIFSAHFSGIEKIVNELFSDVPDEWLKKQAELMLSEAERAEIEAMGGFEKLIETLKIDLNVFIISSLFACLFASLAISRITVMIVPSFGSDIEL